MSLEDSGANTQTQTNQQFIEPDYITAVDPYNDQQNQRRISQQDLAPSAVAPRFISVVHQFDTTRRLFSGLVPSGASMIVNTVTRNSSDNRIVQFVGRQIYIGSSDLANRMPEVVSSSLYPHYDWDAMLDDGGVSILNQPGTAVHKTQVRNNSGSTQTIFVETVTRYIVNNSDEVTS